MAYCFAEDDFPCLERKPSAARRDRERGERKGKTSGGGCVASGGSGFVVKTIVVEEGEKLGRRRRARILSECDDELACDVPYSVNRKGRWNETSDGAAMAENAVVAGSTTTVAVTETAGGRKKKGARLASAVHFADPSVTEVRTASAKGAGAIPSSLLARLSESSDDGTDTPRRPLVMYTITTRAAAARGDERRGEKKVRSRRAGAFTVCPDDTEFLSEAEDPVVIGDANSWKRSREPSFCLGDYIKQDNKDTVVIDASSAPTAAAAARRETLPAADDNYIFVNQSPDMAARASVLEVRSGESQGSFGSVLVNTKQWAGATVNEQMRSLVAAGTARWLDANERRCAIDCTTALDENSSKLLLVVVLEKTRAKSALRILLNSVYNCTAVMDELKTATSLDQLIQMITETGRRRHSARKDAAPSALLRPEYNSSLLSTATQCIPLQHLLEVARQTCQSCESGEEDAFDRVLDSDDAEVMSDTEAEDEDQSVEVVDKQLSRVWCSQCHESREEELFETTDDWACRACLSRSVLAAIRQKSLPLQVELESHPLSSPFHSLCALVPLRVLNIYTAICAPLLKQACDDDEQIVSCAACKQWLKVTGPIVRGSVSCASCRAHFCVGCNGAPHFPLNCEDVASWQARFDPLTESLLSHSSTHLVKMSCECGKALLLPDTVTDTVCPHCEVAFNAHTMVKKHGGVMQSVKCLVPLPPRTLAKEFASLAAEAREERMNRARRESFERAVRKCKPISMEVMSLRAAALLLVETTTAAAYLKKARSPKAALAIKSAWDEVRSAVEDKDVKRATVAVEHLKDTVATVE